MRDRCEGKQRYGTEARALLIVQRLVERSNLPKRANKRLNAYRCKSCGFWHVGHLSIVAFKRTQES